MNTDKENIIDFNDTIAAISTSASSPGGIGIIRISGNDSVNIADKRIKLASGKSLLQIKTHTVNYGYMTDSNGDKIDEVLVTLMKGPHSFTTEDTVEINCHGGIYVMRRILEEILAVGARIAKPGEFTKRAFLNGRIDLAEAEAVTDIINSKNEYALKASVNQLRGNLSEKIKLMREGILDHVAFMEAAMDDPESISMEGHTEILKKDIDTYIKDCEALLKSFSEGRLIRDGIKTCILGRTNAGKSSLLNLLSGYESAIVTDIEGTTRDTVRERIILDGILLDIADTAGIRKTNDRVEQIGVERALEAAADAELLLIAIDCTKELTDEDEKILSFAKSKPAVCLLNKSDLKPVISEKDLSLFMKDKIGITDINIIKFSTVTGEGTDLLKSVINKLFSFGKFEFDDEPVISNIRHKELLEDSKKSLLLVKNALEENISEDLFTVDMMDAYAYLGQILGDDIEDDLADRIFEKFCMGK